jgi:transcriptional regulator with XRE-family HTH domain
MSTIGNRIRAARENKGLTRKALAAEVGCTVQYLSMIEADERTPKMPITAQAIAEALGMDLVVMLRRRKVRMNGKRR